MSEEETVPKLSFIRQGQRVKQLEKEKRQLKARLHVLSEKIIPYVVDVNKEIKDLCKIGGMDPSPENKTQGNEIIALFLGGD